jgi:hypothetical protein
MTTRLLRGVDVILGWIAALIERQERTDPQRHTHVRPCWIEVAIADRDDGIAFRSATSSCGMRAGAGSKRGMGWDMREELSRQRSAIRIVPA